MFPRPIALLPMLALACRDSSDTVPIVPPTTGGDPQTTETGDTGGGGAVPLSDAQGTFLVLQVLPDAFQPGSLFTSGFFAEDLLGYLNAAQCIFYRPPCTQVFPADGETLTPVAGNVNYIFYGEFYDAGTIKVGNAEIPVNNNYGLPFYFGEPTTFSGSGDLEFGGELNPYAGTGVFEHAAELEVTGAEVDEPVLLGPGQSVDFSWNDDSPGEVYVNFGDIIVNPVGNSYSFAATDLGLEAPLDFSQFAVTRQTLQEVEAGGSTVWVQTLSEQWIYVDYEDPTGWTELDATMIADTCAGADALAPIRPDRYLGDTRPFEDDLDLDYGNDATDRDSPGPDGVMRISLKAGERLEVTYQQPRVDGSVYLLPEGCDPDDAEDGSDDEDYGGEESFAYTPREDVVVYLVVDEFNDEGGRFWLEIDTTGGVETDTGTGGTDSGSRTDTGSPGTGTGATGTGTGATGTGTGATGTGTGTGSEPTDSAGPPTDTVADTDPTP